MKGRQQYEQDEGINDAKRSRIGISRVSHQGYRDWERIEGKGMRGALYYGWEARRTHTG